MFGIIDQFNEENSNKFRLNERENRTFTFWIIGMINGSMVFFNMSKLIPLVKSLGKQIPSTRFIGMTTSNIYFLPVFIDYFLYIHGDCNH